MLGGIQDTRGASEVLGAIFVFGILVTAIALYQVTIVPQTNEEVEFTHSAQVRSDMADLRTAMVSTGTDGGRRSVSIDTGATYPTRSLTLNPADPGGQLSTSGVVSDAIRIQHAAASDRDEADFWSGPRSFDSRFVVYRPSYNYYQNAPVTRYEPTVVYSAFPNADVPDTRQSLVDGRTLNVVLVAGDLSRGGTARTSVDVAPISTSTRTVTIEDPGTLSVKTHLSEAVWQEMLNREPHAHVDSYTTNSDAPNVVDISLDSGEWELSVSKVGVGTSGSTDAAYAVLEGSDTRTLDPGETTDMTVGVYDEYGNPVRGETVHWNDGTNLRTGKDGTATYEFTLSTGSTDLEAWIGSASDWSGAPDEKKVELSLSTSSPSTGTPDADLLNPGSGLVLRNATYDKNTNEVHANFENRNTASGAWTNVSAIRVNYYSAQPPAKGTRVDPEEWDSNVTSSQEQITGKFVLTDGSFDVAPDSPYSLQMTFINTDGQKGFNVEEGDYYILSVIFEDGTSRVYFVAPQES